VLTDLGKDPAAIAREGERVRKDTVLERDTEEGRQADG
jgi:hypothetical protein